MQTCIEHAILYEVNGGAPYIGVKYSSLQEAINILEKNFIYDDIQRNRIYFVDNDFFVNKYTRLIGVSNFNYYKIVARIVTEWVGFEEITKENTRRNNLIKFSNYS